MVVSSLPAATEVIKSLSFHRIEFSKFANKEQEIRINFLYMILALLSTEDDACVAQFVNSNSGMDFIVVLHCLQILIVFVLLN